ncbi:MAG: hypothetical protein QXU09_03810 [Thermoproteota archaeon]
MSHFSICKIKIKNPDIELLKQAVVQIAKELNGEIVQEIVDFSGNVQKDFLIAVKTPQIHRGVGIKIENGEVKLVGDFFLVHSAVEAFQKNLIKTYTALAVANSLKNLGYNVQTQKQMGKVVIYAESYY